MSSLYLHPQQSDEGTPWITRWLLRFGEVVARAAWRPAHLAAEGLRGAAWRLVRISWLAGRGILRDQCLLRASALTYITVLSLVPLLALAFAVAKGFGFYAALVHDVIGPFLDRTFGALPAPGETVTSTESGLAMRMAIDQVLGFVDGTKFSALGIVGLLALLFTGLKLLGAVEQAFNDIWDAPRPRSLMRKISDYMAMVVVTPILLFAATGFTTAAHGSAFARFLRDHAGLGGVLDVALRLAPLFALWASFTFLYYAMPNARTKFSSAALGGLVAGILWQGALLLHIQFQVGVASYNAIYSSFAAIPIFLVWVNVSWVIVLLGAELCFAHQSEPSYAEAPSAKPSDPSLGITAGMRAAVRIAASFAASKPPRTSTAIAEDLALPEPAVAGSLSLLARAGILAVADHEGEPCWMLARDPANVRVKDVLDALRRSGARVDLAPRSAADVVADRTLVGLETELQESAHNRTLRELADEVLATPEPGQPPRAIDEARASAAAPGRRARVDRSNAS
ncbi:MAG: YihY family inner membrane protein [Planctomycetota bacterium]|nr:YihY family inner membrane protein [Planctomycetota bacterium]